LSSSSRPTKPQGIGIANLDKPEVQALAMAIFSSARDMPFMTVAVDGTGRGFTAWEWTATSCARYLGYNLDTDSVIMKGEIVKEIPGVLCAVGEKYASIDVSLFW